MSKRKIGNDTQKYNPLKEAFPPLVPLEDGARCHLSKIQRGVRFEERFIKQLMK